MRDPFMYGKSKCATDLVSILDGMKDVHRLWANVTTTLGRENKYLKNVYNSVEPVDLAMETLTRYIKHRRLMHRYINAGGTRADAYHSNWPTTVYNHVNTLLVSKARNYIRDLKELTP